MDALQSGVDAVRLLMKSALTPWGGPERFIDAYDAGIRTATDVLMAIAKTTDHDFVRAFAAASADLTRDVGATQVSSARWIFDV
jgi:hypothetical protein